MVESFEKIVELSLLYDFYGEMLGEHKKKIFEDYVLNDLSLAEIAQEESMTRQGVHDIVRRCTKQLKELESVLHLVTKFQKMKQSLMTASALLEADETEETDKARLEQAKKILKEMLADL